MALVGAVKTSNIDTEVMKANGPVLVDFWAPWCGPCRMVGPIIDQIADEHAGKVAIGKLNVDENPGTAGKYGIMSIPTIILFKGGEPAKKVIGVLRIYSDKIREFNEQEVQFLEAVARLSAMALIVRPMSPSRSAG